MAFQVNELSGRLRRLVGMIIVTRRHVMQCS